MKPTLWAALDSSGNVHYAMADDVPGSTLDVEKEVQAWISEQVFPDAFRLVGYVEATEAKSCA